ncbi:MAG: biotin--[acetyl-CoA-carboxylase] ligase [Magnetococcales bacterium]|nr:biotin--[acetyl-CoA-carboxylase] ligase [Magnetococcales bacterium]
MPSNNSSVDDAPLTAAVMAPLLTGSLFQPHNYHYVAQLDSTSRTAMAMARNGAAEGSVVVAGEQHGGRGRLERSWYHHPSKNLAFSCILRPQIEPMRAVQLTLLTGVALAESVETAGVAGVTLKWPNDLLVAGRKAAGILSEMVLQGHQVVVVVIGVGINVHTTTDDFPPELRQTATSLMDGQGDGQQLPLSRSQLLAAFLHRFTDWYRRFLREGFAPVRQQWLARAPFMGRSVRVMLGNERVDARAIDLDADGFLLVDHPDRGRCRVVSGDLLLDQWPP